MIACKSSVAIMKAAIELGRQLFADHPHKFGPQTFTEPRLVACLALREHQKKRALRQSGWWQVNAHHGLWSHRAKRRQERQESPRQKALFFPALLGALGDLGVLAQHRGADTTISGFGGAPRRATEASRRPRA
jgi:hypothetical protein